MIADSIIYNDRQANEAKAAIQEIDLALSSRETLERIVEGLPIQAVEGVNRALQSERNKLKELVTLYEGAKAGTAYELLAHVQGDMGSLLIAARISKGLTQRELAHQLGLREQAVQRYEADRYRSISLSNFQKFASVLGVRWKFDVEQTLRERFGLKYDVSPGEMKKIIKHARSHNWLNKNTVSEESAVSQIRKTVADHVVRHGTPSLLRTGLNVIDHSEDWLLLSWKAQVTLRSEKKIAEGLPKYNPLNVKWLLDLVKLSREPDGPKQAEELLRQHGIVLVIEPQIEGMKVDGAAFLVDDVPVVALTLRIDTIDNFWFSLLHEVAHVVLHYRVGLSSGFFDEFGELRSVDELEDEANRFAGNLLIPEERWKRSPARISKNAAPIEAFAKSIGVHPAIVFGRVRMERNNYALFSNKIGRGSIRRQFLPDKGVDHD
ncbi:MAG: XRE family transcriptional regulator [Pseudomonadota bacterium]